MFIDPIRRPSKLIIGIALLLTTSTLFAGPKIQHWINGNGARVYYVPAMDLPMADIRVVFDAGSARDGDQQGIAVMTNGMLSEGAGGISTNEISEQFANLGAKFGNGAMRDMAWLSLRTLTEPEIFTSALQLMETIINKPDFPAENMERERQRLLVYFQQEKQRAGKLADRAFFTNLYGDHPYGHNSNGNEESIKRLKQSDLKEFYKKYYVARNAIVAIVGAVKRRAAERIADQLTAGLPRGMYAPQLPEVKPLAAAKEVSIEHASTQTHLFIGQLGMRRGDPDYYDLYVGNHILGGSGLVARLSEEVREKRGLAYSVYSYFAPMRREGPFKMGLQTRADQVAEAQNILERELRRFIDDGPTSAEVERSIKSITGGFPLRIDSNRKIIEYTAMIGFYDLPLDYLDRLNDYISKVTAESIRDAFRRRINPDRLLVVKVGAPAGS